MVLNHSQDLAAQLMQHGLEKVAMVLATQSCASHLASMSQLLKAYGYFALLDANQRLDVSGLTLYSIWVHLKNVFTCIITNKYPKQQCSILRELTRLVDAINVRSALQKTLPGLTSKNIRAAHELLERDEMIGKIVLNLGSAH